MLFYRVVAFGRLAFLPRCIALARGHFTSDARPSPCGSQRAMSGDGEPRRRPLTSTLVRSAACIYVFAVKLRNEIDQKIEAVKL